MPPLPTAEASHLLATYAWAIDGKQYTLMEDVFTVDVEADYQGFACRGRDELVDHLERLHRDLRTTQHLVGSVMVERVDDSGAQVRSQVRATLVATSGRRLEVAARYEDTLLWTDSGWLVSARRVVGAWMSGDRTILPWMAQDVRTEHDDGRGLTDAQQRG